ncbi:MAG: YSC84-related protein [Acidaminococcaceae bacterium]
MKQMRSSLEKIGICLFMLLTFMVSTVAAESLESKKHELRQKTAVTLTQLYKKQPSAQRVIENAAGYAVFNNTGFKLGIFGSAHGRGMAISNETDQEVFMKMQEFQAGLGLGIKEYALIFVFNNQELWEDFVNNGWEFNAQATAAAEDGVNGASMQGALAITPGMWMYQMTTKGLALELAVKGTRYFRDKRFD